MKFFIKEAREKAGLSQKELAELIGVAPNTMHGYESGKHDPKADILYRVFDVLQEVVGSIPIVSTKKNTGKTVKSGFPVFF